LKAWEDAGEGGVEEEEEGLKEAVEEAWTFCEEEASEVKVWSERVRDLEERAPSRGGAGQEDGKEGEVDGEAPTAKALQLASRRALGRGFLWLQPLIPFLQSLRLLWDRVVAALSRVLPGFFPGGGGREGRREGRREGGREGGDRALDPGVPEGDVRGGVGASLAVGDRAVRRP
jgi:hypothetical protein